MSLTYEIEKKADCDRVIFNGPLDESSGGPLRELLHRGGPKVIFNFAKIEYINSLGARNWMNFLRSFSEVVPNRQIVFEECTFDIISQVNMYPGFRGNADITSFTCEFFCEACNAEDRELFTAREDVEELAKEITSRKCRKCGSTLELEEPIESILYFLNKDA